MDTSVWSLALRRRGQDLNSSQLGLVEEWRDLVRDGRAHLIGPVRQEILSGIRLEKDFKRLRERLADFDDIPITRADWENAAAFFNACRRGGVTGGGVDFLICSVAERLGIAVFTTDPDFDLYSRHIPVRLHGR